MEENNKILIYTDNDGLTKIDVKFEEDTLWLTTAAEVSASLINGVRVRFLPEVERNSGRQVITRSMVNTKIVWEEWGKTSTSTGTTPGDNTGGTPGGNDGDQGENPLG